MEEKSKVTIEFDNQEAAENFADWLCGQGEQDYWLWMECREMEKKNYGKNITATEFLYHEEDERYAKDDRRRYGKFFKDNIIKTICGRLTDRK